MGELAGWLGQAAGVVAVVLATVDIVAILLLVAVVVRERRRLFGGLSWSSVPWGAVGGGVGGVVLAVVLATAFDVPVAVRWLTVLALVLVFLVRLRDKRFWRGLGGLAMVSTVVGVLLMLATNLTVVRDDGAAFYGVVRLTEIGGPNMNPEYGAWWIPLCVTAFLWFGLPTALVVTLSWLVATRADLSRLERVAIVLVMARFVVMVFEAPAFTLVYLAFGAFGAFGAFVGVAAWRIAVGILPAVAVYLVVGSGGVGGLLTGGRAAFGLVPVVRAAGTPCRR